MIKVLTKDDFKNGMIDAANEKYGDINPIAGPSFDDWFTFQSDKILFSFRVSNDETITETAYIRDELLDEYQKLI